MGRNDGYHHHHNKLNYHGSHRGPGNKNYQQHYQQNVNSGAQPCPTLEPFDNQHFPNYQLPPFIPVQPPLINQQYPPIFNQPLQVQQNAQQLYFNLATQAQHHHQQQYSHNPSAICNDIANTNSQTIQTHQCIPSINQTNLIPDQYQSWLSAQTSIQPNSNPQSGSQAIEQTITQNALGRLQLPPEQITGDGIIPNTPYYELPAALMVPHIAPNQREYKPINPADLRLPLPKFPDENFLRAIDSYYGSDGKVRDNDGWDREFIDRFIGQKQALAESE